MATKLASVIAIALVGALLSACGGGTSTATVPLTDETTATTEDTTATDTTTTEEPTTTAGGSGGEKSQSDLAQQIAACVTEEGGNPKIDTLGDRVTIGVELNGEQVVFAVLTDGRNAENFVQKLIADGADPNSVFYSKDQPVVTYFPQGKPSKATLDIVNHCVYEYQL